VNSTSIGTVVLFSAPYILESIVELHLKLMIKNIYFLGKNKRATSDEFYWTFPSSLRIID
jgi:hypothetical protein